MQEILATENRLAKIFQFSERKVREYFKAARVSPGKYNFIQAVEIFVEKNSGKDEAAELKRAEKDLKELLEKNELLNIEKLEKILINTAKISDNTDFIKKLKIDGTMVLEKKHLHLFYYFLVNFFEKDIETEIKKFRKFFETNN